MARLMLNDEHWSKLRKIMRDHGVYHKPNLRMMVEGMLYRMRVGCPWRDLPPDKYRHLVENVFARLKHFRAMATRYDKLKRNYKSMLALACGFMWLPM